MLYISYVEHTLGAANEAAHWGLVQTSTHGLPPTRLLFIPPSSRHTALSASHLRVRMNCKAAAHSNLTLSFMLALSLPSSILPFVTVVAAI